MAVVCGLLLPVVQTNASVDVERSRFGLPKLARSAFFAVDPYTAQLFRRAKQLDSQTIDSFRAIADLNNDSIDEIVLDHYDLTWSGANVFPDGTYTPTILDGRTGKREWSVEISFIDGFAGLSRFNVGRHGVPGVLLFKLDFFSTAYTVTYDALDGKGQRVWQQILPSTWNWNTGESWTSPVAIATDSLVAADRIDAPGKADDLLIGQADYVDPPAEGKVVTTDVSILDGATGELVPTDVSVISTHKTPIPAGVKDLDHDGFDDFVMITKEKGEDGRLSAYSSSDHSVVWDRRFDFSMQGWAHGMRDLVGDRTPDVLIGYDTWSKEWFGVADGATGKVRWMAQGLFPYVLGDVDGDQRLDFGAFHLDDKMDRFLAYDNAGKPIYDVGHKIDRSTCDEDFCFTFGFYMDAGDVTNDGIRDRYMQLSTSWDNSEVTYMTSGRTGQMIHDDSGFVPVRGSLDGYGDDLAWAQRSDRGLSVTTFDGRDLSPIWRIELRGPTVGGFADSFFPYDAAATLNRDRCSDLLVGIRKGESLTLVAIDGNSGSVLWNRSMSGRSQVRVKTRDFSLSPC